MKAANLAARASPRGKVTGRSPQKAGTARTGTGAWRKTRSVVLPRSASKKTIVAVGRHNDQSSVNPLGGREDIIHHVPRPYIGFGGPGRAQGDIDRWHISFVPDIEKGEMDIDAAKSLRKGNRRIDRRLRARRAVDRNKNVLQSNDSRIRLHKALDAAGHKQCLHP